MSEQNNSLSPGTETLAEDLFGHVAMAPPDPILGTALAFQKDPSENKINLGIGAYRDGEGKPYIFKAVQEAERIVMENNHNKVTSSLFRSISPLMAQPFLFPGPGDSSSEIVQRSMKAELSPLRPSLGLELFTLGSIFWGNSCPGLSIFRIQPGWTTKT